MITPRYARLFFRYAALLALVMTGAARAVSPYYSTVDLQVSNTTITSGLSVNATGDVAGLVGSTGSLANWFLARPGGVVTGMQLMPNTRVDVNDSGQIAGTAYSQAPNQRAFLWNSGTVTWLPAPAPYIYPVAWSINNAGDVAGTVAGNVGPPVPVVWKAGAATLLPLPERVTMGEAYAVNNNGDVAGFVRTTGGERATAWRGGVPVLLDMPPTPGQSRAAAINDAGWCAGYVVGPQQRAAAVWAPDGTLTIIGALPGDVSSEATAINNNGQVVGFSTSNTRSTRGFLYSAGVLEPLDSLLVSPSIRVTAAGDINDAGRIAATATIAGRQRAVRLEPSALPRLVFRQNPGFGASGALLQPQPVLEVRDATGRLISDFNGAVTLGLRRNGQVMNGLTGTLTAQAINGVATFSDIAVVPPNDGYTLVAMASGVVTGESAPFVVGAPVLYVRPGGSDSASGASWAAAKATIAAAAESPLGTAATEIWVAAGTYSGPVTLRDGASLYGGFTGAETERRQRDPWRHAAIVQGADGIKAVRGIRNPVTIDGFTIRNVPDAIYLLEAGAFIRNNTLTGNIRGITADYNSPVVIENNTVTLSRQGAVNVVTAGSVIRGNRIIRNAGDIFTAGVSATGALVERNFIAYNVATQETGGVTAGPGSVVRDNLIIGNSSSRGLEYADGILARSGAVISNNTIAGNAASSAAIVVDGAPVIANNIIAYNAAGIGVASGRTGAPVVSHNLFYANWTGDAVGVPAPVGRDGNIHADPGFVSLENGNFYILPDSPARNAGDNAFVAPDEADMDGTPRIQDGVVDIGADESDGSTPHVTGAVIRVSVSGSDANDGYTWGNAKRTVSAAAAAVSAAGGGEVWVGAGTYLENVTLGAFCRLYGGFAGTETHRDQRDPVRNVTTLNARGRGSVVTAPPGTFQAAVDGFTLENGGPDQAQPAGGHGVVAMNGATINVSHNTIRNNAGRGVIGLGMSRVAENHIYGNAGQMGGGIVAGDAATVVRNIVERNSSAPSYFDAAGIATYSTGNVAFNVVRNNMGAGIASRGTARILGNSITGNTGFGVTLEGNPNALKGTDVELRDNVIGGNGGGITARAPGVVSLVNNTIANNTAEGFTSVWPKAAPLLVNNIVAFNGTGISMTNGFDPIPVPEARANNVFGNRTNFTIGDFTGANGNISADPKFADTTRDNYHLQPNSPCRDAGDSSVVLPDEVDVDGQPRIQGAAVDIGADESDLRLWTPVNLVVHVRQGGNNANDGSTWATAKASVQAAMDALSGSGGDVWVAAGTYAERLSLAGAIGLYGGFAGTEDTRDARDPKTRETVLDAGGQGSVIVVTGTAAGATVDGFTLRNGKGSPMFVGSANVARGGGIQMSGARLTVSNNIIENGWANDGGGIYSESAGSGSDSGPTIVNNVIRGNNASGNGGGLYVTGPATISRNVIENNTAPNGGGVYGYWALVPSVRPFQVLNNVVRGNSAATGGGVFSASGTVAGNLITGNSASASGGGLYAPGAAIVANNTITGNTAPAAGGVDTANGMDLPTLRNNIIAFNSSGIVQGIRAVMLNNDVFGNTEYDYSGTGPNRTGTNGNISTDPLFRDRLAGDFRLAASSPCIDAGILPAYTDTDLAGMARIFGAGIDMGAYEYHGAGAAAPVLDVRTALRIAGGLAPGGRPGGSISILDAVRLNRDAASAGE